jgi:hypothetical protein
MNKPDLTNYDNYYISSGDIRTPVSEYFKDKPIEYEKYISFISLNKAEEWKWINNSHVNIYSGCLVALVSTCLGFNPYANPEEYIKSKGFSVMGYANGTGAYSIIIK